MRSGQNDEHDSSSACSAKSHSKETSLAIFLPDSDSEPSISNGEPSIIPNANCNVNPDADQGTANDARAELALLLNENEYKKIDIQKDADKSNDPSLFSSSLPIIQGISRDLPWAFLTATEANWFRKLGLTWGPWLTQLSGSAGGLLLSSAGFFALNPRYRSRKGVAIIAVYASASLLSMIPWNYAQTLGADQGQNELGMSPEGASYFSALYTAIFEAVVQYAVISAASAMLDPKEKEKWKFDFNHCAQRAAEFLLNMPGGGMWQVVYQATYNWAKKNLQNALIASGGVAFSVGTTTVLTTKLAEKITAALDDYANKIKNKDKNDIEAKDPGDKALEHEYFENDPEEIQEQNLVYKNSP